MGVNVESMSFLFRWRLQAGGSFKQHLQGFLTLIGLQQGAGVWQPALKSDEGLRFVQGRSFPNGPVISRFPFQHNTYSPCFFHLEAFGGGLFALLGSQLSIVLNMSTAL